MKPRGTTLLCPPAVVLCIWMLCKVCLQATAQVDNATQVCQQLDPSPVLQKFVDELPHPQIINVSDGNQLVMGTYKIMQKLHRDLPPTPLYAYGRNQSTASVPGPTLVAVQGVEAYVRWENHIYDSGPMLTVDNTVMWANPPHGGVPLVTHLHGAEADSQFDGYPDSWYTAQGDYGPTYTTKNYTYANTQRPSTLWYHDHAFGITRLNVLSGLAGGYLTLPKTGSPSWLPTGQYDVLLIVQDKQLFHNGSINFPNVGDSPAIHPQWCPEYFGDTIIVNGKAWPYFRVEPKKYRFRLLNAANARVFIFSLSEASLSFIQIGSDGGLLLTPQVLKNLTLAPAERVEFIIDFSLVPGSKVYMNNSGPAPYPSGTPAFSPPSVNSVMEFIVQNTAPDAGLDVPSSLRDPDPPCNTTHALVRQLFLWENDDQYGEPINSLLNNLTWRDPVTEEPYVGSTEIWEFIDFTPDAHPMHIHLITFKVLNQQPFNQTLWMEGGCQLLNATARFGEPGSCFTTEPEPPSANQVGWKDTVLVLPSYVTRVLVRWTSHTGGPFPFDATVLPGYVWHCHILDHEDNDMMRPIMLRY